MSDRRVARAADEENVPALGLSEGWSAFKTDGCNPGRLPLTGEEVGSLEERKKECCRVLERQSLREQLKEKQRGLTQGAVFHTELWLEPLVTMTHIKRAATTQSSSPMSTSGGLLQLLQSSPDEKQQR